jgi:DNA uptake protein ComE-like DNA-binding protein
MMDRRAETVLVPLLLCLAATLSQAADAPPAKASRAGAAHAEQVLAKKDEAAAPAFEPVDINSASKADLKKLPGIDNAQADRLIAGRPYLSKAHLQTRNIVSPAQYQVLRELVVARQKDAKFGKSVNK